MTVHEALKYAVANALIDGAKQAAYRTSWEDDPTTKGTVIVYRPNKYGDFHYWYTLANPPKYPWEDDARVGPPIGVLSINDVMAEDWEVRNV